MACTFDVHRNAGGSPASARELVPTLEVRLRLSAGELSVRTDRQHDDADGLVEALAVHDHDLLAHDGSSRKHQAPPAPPPTPRRAQSTRSRSPTAAVSPPAKSRPRTRGLSVRATTSRVYWLGVLSSKSLRKERSTDARQAAHAHRLAGLNRREAADVHERIGA
eukprot:762638-Hanusia_phi.AAC.5